MLGRSDGFLLIMPLHWDGSGKSLSKVQNNLHQMQFQSQLLAEDF